MEELFAGLSHALDATVPLALGAALIWGLLSILLSPCHLSSIPLIVAFVGNQQDRSTRTAFYSSSCFAAGIMLTIAAIGVLTAGVGRIMGDVGAWPSYMIAAVFLLVGLYLLEIVKLPWALGGNILPRKTGFVAAFVLGILFGLAVGPCTFAYMAPVLAVTFKVAGKSFAYAVALLACYAVGHCFLIVIAGTSTRLVGGYLNWNERSGAAVWARRICGVALIAAGLYAIYKAKLANCKACKGDAC